MRFDTLNDEKLYIATRVYGNLDLNKQDMMINGLE